MRLRRDGAAGAIPHTPYYGTVDATPLFVMALCRNGELDGRRGALPRSCCRTSQRALEWIERLGRSDGDGFVEYVRAAASGAHRAIRSGKTAAIRSSIPDGQPCPGPSRWSRCRATSTPRTAGWPRRLMRAMAMRTGRRLRAASGGASGAQVEEAFWLPRRASTRRRWTADKRPVAAITSNAGHLLYCGLPSPERAGQVAERLRQPELDSGWGVRTVASNMRSYNPMSYHNGSVWPHDNSLIAACLARYGAHDELERIASSIFAVAQRLPDHRLPELYCGFSRHHSIAEDWPVPYPVSCSPQAWAAGAVPLLVRAMLGLEADPKHGGIFVSPSLPGWLPRVRIQGMRALGHTLDLDVAREGDGYRIRSEVPVEQR